MTTQLSELTDDTAQLVEGLDALREWVAGHDLGSVTPAGVSVYYSLRDEADAERFLDAAGPVTVRTIGDHTAVVTSSCCGPRVHISAYMEPAWIGTRAEVTTTAERWVWRDGITEEAL